GRMADPPSVRRPQTKPPPIPPRTSMGALGGPTEVVPVASATEETTNSVVQPPDATQLVARVLGLIASETAALLDGDHTDEQLADLNIRTALASWDALQLRDDAWRLIELAEHHPLAPRLQ